MKICKEYKYYILIVLTIVFAILALRLEGHTFLSQSGKVYFWMGHLSGGEVSQHLTDWYSPSHFIHGLIFFFLLGLLGNVLLKRFNSRTTYGFKLWLAILIEGAWEILENSPIIINRYREGALAAGYFGDSVLNSLSDLTFMTLGFLFASKFGWKYSLFVLLFLEILTLLFIRDNLTLNIIMLLHPFSAISRWQVGL
jgi:hypothetical protein